MKVLISPSVRDSIEILKRKLRQFELSELEKFLTHIEKNPKFGVLDKDNKLSQRIIENDYFFCIAVYEYLEKKDQLIFISIELIKK